MRSVRFAVGLMALACGSCGGPAVAPMERHGMLQATYGAYGQPAGYYPGRAEPFGGDPSEYRAWLAKNQAGIDEIQRRIVEIGNGTRAPGCIGEDKYTCIAALAQKLAIADQFFLKDFNIFAETKYDVNGKPLTGSKITFDGYLPSAKDDFSPRRAAFHLTLRPDGTVSSVEAQMPKDPALAQTQEEYDATDIYEIVWAATAKTCPALSRADVAKWIENTVKASSRLMPRERGRERDTEVHDFRELKSKQTAFCGRTFEFESASGTIQHGFAHDPFETGSVVIR